MEVLPLVLSPLLYPTLQGSISNPQMDSLATIRTPDTWFCSQSSSSLGHAGILGKLLHICWFNKSLVSDYLVPFDENYNPCHLNVPAKDNREENIETMVKSFEYYLARGILYQGRVFLSGVVLAYISLERQRFWKHIIAISIASLILLK